ncbi:retrovirus-related pol polyprotein from transposon TNT 1-94 [Tanacetum coccineum]
MVANLRYFNSLELEVDSLKSQLDIQKTQFLNEIDRLSRKYYYADHVNAILGVYIEMDEVTNLQCDNLEALEKCQRLEKDLSKSRTMSKSFEALQKHAINLELDLQQYLKAQLQDKGIAISELKKLIEKMKGNSVETKVIPSASVSRPQLKSNRIGDRVMSNNSHGKKQEVEDQRRNFKFSNNKMSITACNDNLNAKTSNVNFVYVTYGKGVLNDNHDMCVLHYINGVNSRTGQPIAVPISTREPKQTLNQSIATSHKKSVATDYTVKKTRNIIRKIYEQVSKTCSWWYPKFTPPGYKWKPKSPIGNVNLNLVDIILFIVDFGCSKHMTGNLKLLTNFVEKFLGTDRHEGIKCGMLSEHDIGEIYRRCVHADAFDGAISGWRVGYRVFCLGWACISVGGTLVIVLWTLMVVGEGSGYSDRDKGRNSECKWWWGGRAHYGDVIRYGTGVVTVIRVSVDGRQGERYLLRSNDLLIGSCGTDLYFITLQEKSIPSPICLMGKATSSQAWLWHRRLSHLNFDTINLLSKNNIVIGLPKLKFVKDHLCSSCELGKAKRKFFHIKTTLSSKRRLQLLHMDLCGLMRVESINGKKYVLVIVDDYSRYTRTHFLRSKDETPAVLIDFLTLV